MTGNCYFVVADMDKNSKVAHQQESIWSRRKWFFVTSYSWTFYHYHSYHDHDMEVYHVHTSYSWQFIWSDCRVVSSDLSWMQVNLRWISLQAEAVMIIFVDIFVDRTEHYSWCYDMDRNAEVLFITDVNESYCDVSLVCANWPLLILCDTCAGGSI